MSCIACFQSRDFVPKSRAIDWPRQEKDIPRTLVRSSVGTWRRLQHFCCFKKSSMANKKERNYYIIHQVWLRGLTRRWLSENVTNIGMKFGIQSPEFTAGIHQNGVLHSYITSKHWGHKTNLEPPRPHDKPWTETWLFVWTEKNDTVIQKNK
jgi:hypothetical protein